MITVLTGGTGGAKFVWGLAQIVPADQFTVIVNTGDDLTWWDLHISPDLDSILYVLPRGALRESLPAPITMRASFGSFQSSSVAVGDSAILYTRRLDILTSEIAPDRYPEYVKFMTEVAKADRAQAVLRVP